MRFPKNVPGHGEPPAYGRRKTEHGKSEKVGKPATRRQLEPPAIEPRLPHDVRVHPGLQAKGLFSDGLWGTKTLHRLFGDAVSVAPGV